MLRVEFILAYKPAIIKVKPHVCASISIQGKPVFVPQFRFPSCGCDPFVERDWNQDLVYSPPQSGPDLLFGT